MQGRAFEVGRVGRALWMASPGHWPYWCLVRGEGHSNVRVEAI